MFFYSYWLFQWMNLANIQHICVKFNVPPFHPFSNFRKVGGDGIMKLNKTCEMTSLFN